jgi:GAF domain-containing protein
MAAYRLYFLGTDGGIQAREDFAAEDDIEANTIADLLLHACADCYQGYELWQARRLLARKSALSAADLEIERLDRPLQGRVLAMQEKLLGSHWRVAESARLLAATESLRRGLAANGPAEVSPRDVVRYICGNTGARMMSLQLADGMRLLLRGSRGFERIFDEFFAVVATGHCACGVAFENAQQIVVPSIESSPIFAGQEALDVLRGQGVAACVSTPLPGSNGGIAGMFSIHRDTVWNPFDGELAQLRHIAREIAAAFADPLGAVAQRIRTAV